MNRAHRLRPLVPVHEQRDVRLARALTDHLHRDVRPFQRREGPLDDLFVPSNVPDERDERMPGLTRHARDAVLLEISHERLELLLHEVARPHLRRVQRQRHAHLGSRDAVHGNFIPLHHLEHRREKPVLPQHPRGDDVQHRDALLLDDRRQHPVRVVVPSRPRVPDERPGRGDVVRILHADAEGRGSTRANECRGGVERRQKRS